MGALDLMIRVLIEKRWLYLKVERGLSFPVLALCSFFCRIIADALARELDMLGEVVVCILLCAHRLQKLYFRDEFALENCRPENMWNGFTSGLWYTQLVSDVGYPTFPILITRIPACTIQNLEKSDTQETFSAAIGQHYELIADKQLMLENACSDFT